MTGYDFHPEARSDIDHIWEFVRADNLDAAGRMIAEILTAIRALVPFPVMATGVQTSRHGLYASFWRGNI
jgi:plasmid stabilization system protein ParE